ECEQQRSQIQAFYNGVAAGYTVVVTGCNGCPSGGSALGPGQPTLSDLASGTPFFSQSPALAPEYWSEETEQRLKALGPPEEKKVELARSGVPQLDQRYADEGSDFLTRLQMRRTGENVVE